MLTPAIVSNFLDQALSSGKIVFMVPEYCKWKFQDILVEVKGTESFARKLLL